MTAAAPESHPQGVTADVLSSSSVPAVSARDVHKSFSTGDGAVEILHGVSLDVPYGEMVAIMGPSGSGKSTLLYCLAGLEAATSGTVALANPASILSSGIHAPRTGQVDPLSSSGYTASQGLMMLMVALVAVPVIGSVTGLVVDSRRGSLARLGLAGATPHQIRSTVMTQLVAVTLACSVLGDVFAALLTKPALALLAYNQRDEDYFTVIDVHWSLWPFLGANVLCVLVALLGRRKHARRASLTPPVEALREGPPHRPYAAASA